MRTLILDIETSPIIAMVWGLHDQNVSLNQIKEDWRLLAWSAKWLGEPAASIMYMDTRNSDSDKGILKVLWNLLDKADIVITQNGQSFDGPKLNARFVLHGFAPPSPYRHLDTYRIAKRVFEFTSNKLEYLTDKLCTKYKKLSHKKFPGMSLWTECLKGNKEAWEEMKRYNIHDVLSTEELYEKIKAWAPETMPKPHGNTAEKCGVCGKYDLQKRGTMRTLKLIFQRYQCQSCGAWSKGPKPK
jgi:DNA polymerase elongation subunit (family B)